MNSKILHKGNITEEIEGHRSQKKKIVFINGCFDILHVGHVRYLSKAKAKGDILVVGLNADDSVTAIKGKARPIVGQEDRAEVLSALECVDYVTIFDELDPLALIKIIKPDILVKGSDWAIEKIIGGDVVQAYGGDVVQISFVPGISTSEIIERVKERRKGVRM